MHRAVAVTGRNDRRLIDAGAAVGPGEFMAAAQQLPVEHGLEVGGGASAEWNHVQQTVEFEHGSSSVSGDPFWHHYLARSVAGRWPSDGSK
jgi:hypothetical protein